MYYKNNCHRCYNSYTSYIIYDCSSKVNDIMKVNFALKEPVALKMIS